MLGPLPTLHRYVIVGAALLLGAVLGAWLGWASAAELPLSGAAVGGILALAASLLLVHDFPRRNQPH